ncbi:hypothetical protein ACC736_38125, partial [Rhizobium ruizarguesonis]
AGTVIAQQWTQAGIATKVDVAGPTNGQRLSTGDFEAAIYCSIETWGGHPDLSFFLDSYHSDFIKLVETRILTALQIARRLDLPDRLD